MFGRQVRRLYRRLFPRMTVPTADKWSRRLRYLYTFFAWNAVGFIVYHQLTKKPASEEERRYATFGWALPMAENVTKIKMHGFSKIEFTPAKSADEQLVEEDQESNDMELAPDKKRETN